MQNLRHEREKEIVRKWFPVLLKEDPSFREEVMAQLTGILATKDDIAKILAKLEEHSKILQEHGKILQEHGRILQEHTVRIDKFERTLSAIGARWGVIAEDAFREGMRGILEDIGYSVRKWRIRDEEGLVYGRSSMVEADLLIKDGQHMLIEIKSSVSRFDMAGFKKLADLYEKIEGTKARLLVISPFIDSRARVLGEELGIEIYSSPEEAMKSN